MPYAWMPGTLKKKTRHLLQNDAACKQCIIQGRQLALAGGCRANLGGRIANQSRRLFLDDLIKRPVHNIQPLPEGAARKDFEEFPEHVQRDKLTALTTAAEGEKSDNAKPFKGIDGDLIRERLRQIKEALK